MSAYGQNAPEFDAASIRVTEPGGFQFGSGASMGGPGTGDPGLYRCSRCTLATLISKAYDLQNYQLPGRTSLPGTTFEVMARVPAGTSDEAFHLMLQNLLKDRFGLAGHFSEKALRGYHLVVGKNGSKLQESTGGARPAASAPQHGGFGGQGGGPGGDHGHTGVIAFGGNARYRADNQTVADLARVLSDQVGLPVDDQTGLKGKYDISLNWNGSSQDSSRGAGPGGEGHGDHGGGGGPGGAPGGARRESGDTSGPALLDAVQAQLGLRLVRADQATARIFNIDHVQQLPTAN